MSWLYVFISSFILSAALCRSQHNQQSPELGAIMNSWDQQRLLTHLQVFSAKAHPMGSERQAQLSQWLFQTMTKAGFKVSLDSFIAEVPDPLLLSESKSVMRKLSIDLKATNVYAKLRSPHKDCIILLGSHYDSKYLNNQESIGANDSGSSSAALIEIMSLLQNLADSGALGCNVMATWFDGEESTLLNWRDGQDLHPAKLKDNLYGSRHLAKQLQPCGGKLCLPKNLGGEEVRALVLLDMIGMPNVKLSLDSSSDRDLMQRARDLDKSMHDNALLFQTTPKAIEDDHWPFKDRGLPVIDFIDFENLQTWHQSSDRLETLDLQSIRKVSLFTTAFILEISRS